MDDDSGGRWAANSIFFFTVCNSESAERSHSATRTDVAVVLRGQCCKTDGSFSTSHFFLYTHLEMLAVNTEGILRHLATGERF